MENTVPCPSLLRTRIVPLLFNNLLRNPESQASPNHFLGGEKRFKIFFCRSKGIPEPLSATVNRTRRRHFSPGT